MDNETKRACSPDGSRLPSTLSVRTLPNKNHTESLTLQVKRRTLRRLSACNNNFRNRVAVHAEAAVTLAFISFIACRGRETTRSAAQAPSWGSLLIVMVSQFHEPPEIIYNPAFEAVLFSYHNFGKLSPRTVLRQHLSQCKFLCDSILTLLSSASGLFMLLSSSWFCVGGTPLEKADRIETRS